jgi:hypothetical protein
VVALGGFYLREGGMNAELFEQAAGLLIATWISAGSVRPASRAKERMKASKL